MDQTLEKLSECVKGITLDVIPEEVLHQTKLRLLDYLGCVIGAFNQESAKRIRNVAIGFGTSFGGASLLGTSRRCSADMACFVNGMMGRYLDFNDQYSGRTTGHPSDVIPAVLAAVEISGKSGADTITGILAGYEVFGRLCDAVTLRPKWDHVTLGAISAAGAASNAMGLSRDKTKQAISIATVSNVALDETRRGNLSHWKAGAFPNASRQGLFAALLAKEGITGPDLPFHGGQGFWNSVAFPEELGALDGDPDRYKLMDTAIKAHSACYLDLSAVDAILALREDVRIEDVEKIIVYVYRYSIELTADGPMKWRPSTRETADHSLPYILATALREGYIGPEHYKESLYKDQDVLDLMDKVEVREDPVYTQGFPEIQSQRVELVTRTGDTKIKKVDYPKGHPLQPMDDSEVIRKFDYVLGGLLSDDHRISVVNKVMALQDCPDISNLFDDLVVRQRK